MQKSCKRDPGAARHQTLQGVSTQHSPLPSGVGLARMYTPYAHPWTCGQSQGDQYRNLLSFGHSTAEGYRKQIMLFWAYSQSTQLSRRSWWDLYSHSIFTKHTQAI